MRPIRLEISGLNSFRGRETIEFEPLMMDGLFGIFGPTGSGKSTILDGITLALYGKVKRAPLGKNGIINAREKQCVVSFQFEAGVGDLRKAYRVERSLAPSRTEGVATKKVRLIELRADGDIPLAEKQSEVAAKVEEILGINLDDFLRAVVLPQGSFAEFLGLPPKERSGVLQRIFNLQDLGQKLSIKLRQEIALLRTSRAGLDGRLLELRAYDDQALDHAEAAYTVALAESEERRGALDAAARALQEGRQLLELVEELEALRDEEKGSSEKMARLSTLRERIAIAERSVAVEPLIAAFDRTSVRHRQATEELDAAVEERGRGAGALESATELLSREQREHDSCYDLICSQINILHQIEEERETLLHRRERQQALDAAITALDDDIRIREESRAQIAAHLDLLDRNLATMEEEIERAILTPSERESLDLLRRRQQDLKRLSSAIAERSNAEAKLAGSIARLASDLDATGDAERKTLVEITTMQKELDDLRGTGERLESDICDLRLEFQNQNLALKDLTHAEEKREKLRADLAVENAAIERHLEEQIKVTFEIDAAIEAERVALERREEVMALREASRNRLAVESLLHTLRDGEPCPLCGALEHPAPHISEAAGDTGDLDRMLAEADTMLRASSEQKAVSSQRMAAVQVQLQGSRERRGADATGLEELGREIAELLLRLPGSVSVQTAAELRARVENITAEGQRKAVEQKQAADRVKRLTDQLALLATERNEAARRSSALDASRSGQQIRLADIQSELAALRAEHAAALHDLQAEGAAISIEQIDTEVGRLLEREKRADGLRQQIAEGAADSKRRRETLDKAVREHASAASQREREEGVRAELRKEIVEIDLRITERLAGIIDDDEENGMEIAQLLDRRERRRERVRRAYDQAVAAHRAATVRVEVAAAALERSRKSLDDETAELATVTAAMRDALDRERFATPEEARDAMIEPVALGQLRAEATGIETALATMRERLKELDERLSGRTTTAGEIARIEEEHEQAGRQNDEASQRTGAARNELEKCRKGNIDYHTLMEESSEAMLRAQTADQLQRYLHGEAFVNYLADERLAEICRRATVQLRVLTGGCYELHTRPDDGFYIIDNGNGGGERSPSSLSGGETFLVSLSLALALSDMVQMGRSPLEFFFLDEGFGTLDSDLLDTVMNSLEQLRSHHRTIGVITHVGSLRERIARRLIVHPATEARGSRVEFEVV